MDPTSPSAETGVRRETAGAYLKEAGIRVRPPCAWGRRPPAKPANANAVTTGFGVESTGLEVENPEWIRSALRRINPNITGQ